MLSRNENGKLQFQSLDFQILIGDMFSKCKNEHEVEWVQEQLQSCVECEAEERLSEVEESEDK